MSVLYCRNGTDEIKIRTRNQLLLNVNMIPNRTMETRTPHPLINQPISLKLSAKAENCPLTNHLRRPRTSKHAPNSSRLLIQGSEYIGTCPSLTCFVCGRLLNYLDHRYMCANLLLNKIFILLNYLAPGRCLVTSCNLIYSGFSLNY